MSACIIMKTITHLKSMPRRWHLIAIFSFFRLVQITLRMFEGVHGSYRSSHLSGSQTTITTCWYCLHLSSSEPSFGEYAMFWRLAFIWAALIIYKVYTLIKKNIFGFVYVFFFTKCDNYFLLSSIVLRHLFVGHNYQKHFSIDSF